MMCPSDDVWLWQDGYLRGRIDALEEAARIADAQVSDADDYVHFAALEIAAAIRALKGAQAMSKTKKRPHCGGQVCPTD